MIYGEVPLFFSARARIRSDLAHSRLLSLHSLQRVTTGLQIESAFSFTQLPLVCAASLFPFQSLSLPPTIAPDFQPSYLPRQRCHEDIIRKVCNYASPPTSPTNTVSTLSRLDAFFSLLSFFFLLPWSLPLWVQLWLTLGTETVCFPPTLFLVLGEGKKVRCNTDRERGRRINSCFCLEAVTLHQEHFLGRQGATSLFYLPACPFRAKHIHSR